jgi:hypothetical protein
LIGCFVVVGRAPPEEENSVEGRAGGRAGGGERGFLDDTVDDDLFFVESTVGKQRPNKFPNIDGHGRRSPPPLMLECEFWIQRKFPARAQDGGREIHRECLLAV